MSLCGVKWASGLAGVVVMKDAAPSWGVPSEVVARIVGSPAGRLAGEEK